MTTLTLPSVSPRYICYPACRVKEKSGLGKTLQMKLQSTWPQF